jgi:hypothetical protein
MEDIMKPWIFMTSAVTVALAPLFVGITQANELSQGTSSPNFTGRYIAAISDGDFLASTYHDGKLPNSNAAIDQLSIIPLPLGDRSTISQIPVSNSVTGAPYAMSISPDGKTAFVVETQGAIPPGVTRREQLPAGQQLVVARFL